MWKIDPRFAFIFGIVTTILQGVTSGTVHLSGLIPESAIPYATSWIGFIVFVNMTIMTAFAGLSSAKSGPLAPPPTIPEARAVMVEAVKAKAEDDK